MKERKFNKDIYMNYSLSLKIDERKTVITSLNNSQNKIEKLIEYKSFLQNILGLIKNSQKNLIIKKEFQSNDLSNIKKVLIALKKNLFLLKEDKEKKLKFLENIRNQKIKHFFKLKHTNKCFMHSFKKNFSSNFDSLIAETTGDESYEEISQLKKLNFEVENELQKIENKKKQILSEINYYSLFKAFEKVIKIKYVNRNKSGNMLINRILHKKLIDIRNNFINLASMRNIQVEDINFIKDKINFFKFKLKIKTQSKKKIIRQNKKFYIDTIKEDTEGNDISINTNNTNKYENICGCKKIINDDLDSIKIYNINKDLGNEETNCNSSDKKEYI